MAAVHVRGPLAWQDMGNTAVMGPETEHAEERSTNTLAQFL